MGPAIGDLLPAAVAVAISPIAIIAVVLMLGSARGRTNGLAFLVGWAAGILVAGTILLLLAGAIGGWEDGQPSDRASSLKLVLGAALLVVALRQWRRRPRDGTSPSTPTWMSTLERFSAAKAAGTGAVLASINPKNFVLILAAGVAIAETGIPADEQAIALLVFTVIASIGVAAPIVVSLALGDRSTELLARLESWMAHNNAVIVAAILVVMAAKLIGDAISGLG